MTDPSNSPPPNSTPSPLETVDTEALSLLFNQDPETYTDADITKMIAGFRAQRLEWATEDAKPKAPRGTKKAEKAKAKATPVEINNLLADLGIG